MKIGYIAQYDLKLNPHLTEKFKFKEATFTRRISSRGDRVYSKLLSMPVDYEDIVFSANMMKNKSGLIIVREPFLLDDELREKCLRWVEWANKADEKEYSFFPELCDTEKGGAE
jgi:hypothetical protein